MYLIELIVKTFFKKDKPESYNPLDEEKTTEDYEGCEHIFMPIDSSGETLACTKCGHVITKKELETKPFNIFKI